jgi:3-phosphoshikimate 1-carboxyvinyltransferase
VSANGPLRIARTDRLRGTIAVPGDKSIGHRTLILGALARGWTRIVGLPGNADVGATADALVACGVGMQKTGDVAIVQGMGHARLDAGGGAVDCANSGTSMRLLTGVLAGTHGRAVLFGDASLSKRPMRRVSEPLQKMGAQIELSANGTAPIRITGKRLHGIEHHLNVPSAQVKSALLLAGLFAEGTTTLTGEIASRDHTERLLPVFGGSIDVRADRLSVAGGQELHGAFVRVPGDPSSAAFWIAAALLVPDGDIVLRDVGANPTRLGFLTILKRMGANVSIESERNDAEPVATLRARSSGLRAVEISGQESADAIDELPLLAVVATQAEGTTVVRGARELRVKESDRIEGVAQMLRALGAEIETYDDGFAIAGSQKLRGGFVQPHGDHRIAMAASIAALIAEGECSLDDPGCASVSYPAFYSTLAQLGGKVA